MNKGLWVRSQDKKTIIFATHFQMTYLYETNMPSIITYSIAGDLVLLGSYKSEQIALEIFNDLQKRIEVKFERVYEMP